MIRNEITELLQGILLHNMQIFVAVLNGNSSDFVSGPCSFFLEGVINFLLSFKFVHINDNLR